MYIYRYVCIWLYMYMYIIYIYIFLYLSIHLSTHVCICTPTSQPKIEPKVNFPIMKSRKGLPRDGLFDFSLIFSKNLTHIWVNHSKGNHPQDSLIYLMFILFQVSELWKKNWKNLIKPWGNDGKCMEMCYHLVGKLVAPTGSWVKSESSYFRISSG